MITFACCTTLSTSSKLVTSTWNSLTLSPQPNFSLRYASLLFDLAATPKVNEERCECPARYWVISWPVKPDGFKPFRGLNEKYSK